MGSHNWSSKNILLTLDTDCPIEMSVKILSWVARSSLKAVVPRETSLLEALRGLWLGPSLYHFDWIPYFLEG